LAIWPIQYARGIAQQHPADGQRGFSVAVPERGAAGQVHCEGLSGIPRQVFGLPHRGLVTEAVAQLRLTWPLLGFDARFAFGLGWDGTVELGIEHQTRDQSDTVLATRESEAGGGERAIAYEQEFARRVPAAHQTHEDLGILGNGPIRLAQSLAQRRRAGRDHQDRQRPFAPAPRTGDEQREAHPVDTLGGDDMPRLRAHGVMVAPFEGNLGAPAPFEGPIDG